MDGWVESQNETLDQKRGFWSAKAGWSWVSIMVLPLMSSLRSRQARTSTSVFNPRVSSEHAVEKGITRLMKEDKLTTRPNYVDWK